MEANKIAEATANSRPEPSPARVASKYFTYVHGSGPPAKEHEATVVWDNLVTGLVYSVQTGQPAMVLLSRAVEQRSRSEQRFVTAFRADGWAPESIRIILEGQSATEAANLSWEWYSNFTKLRIDSVGSELEFISAMNRSLDHTLQNSLSDERERTPPLRDKDAFTDGAFGNPYAEYWPRVYFFDPHHGGWQLGLRSTEKSRPHHFAFPLLARALLQRHSAALLRCTKGIETACRHPAEAFSIVHHSAAAGKSFPSLGGCASLACCAAFS